MLHNQIRPQVLLWSYMGSHAGLCDLVGCWLRCTVLLVRGWPGCLSRQGFQLYFIDLMLCCQAGSLSRVPGWVGWHCRLCHGIGRRSLSGPPSSPHIPNYLPPPPILLTKLPLHRQSYKLYSAIRQDCRLGSEVVGTISWVLRLPRAKGYVQHISWAEILSWSPACVGP